MKILHILEFAEPSKTQENLSQDCQSPGQDLKPAPPEQTARVLVTLQRHPVVRVLKLLLQLLLSRRQHLKHFKTASLLRTCL
jgi:hypothetical protein